MKNKPLIWVLADDRAGNVSQALGVAESLDLPFEIKNIHYNSLAKLPNIFIGKSLLGINKSKSSKIEAPWPDIIISAGRKTAPIACYIKKVSGGKTKIIHLMWPSFAINYIDLIVIPEHDKEKYFHKKNQQQNIITTTGAVNRINPERLEKEKIKWADKFSHLTPPYTAVLIGGNTKKGTFTKKHASDFIKEIKGFMKDKQGSLLITNSRRTPEDATKIIKDELKKEGYNYHFHGFDSKDENPYFGYLALSDNVIVSGDSISMCSESCSSGKNTHIYSPVDITPKKHQKFHKSLYKKGYASKLGSTDKQKKPLTLNDAKKMASLIKDKYLP